MTDTLWALYLRCEENIQYAPIRRSVDQGGPGFKIHARFKAAPRDKTVQLLNSDRSIIVTGWNGWGTGSAGRILSRKLKDWVKQKTER